MKILLLFKPLLVVNMLYKLVEILFSYNIKQHCTDYALFRIQYNQVKPVN